MKAISVAEKQRAEIKWRFWASFVTLCILVGQILVVYYSKSIAVGVDTVHVSSDLSVLLGGLLVAIASISITPKKSANVRRIFTFLGLLLLAVGAYYSLYEIHLRMVNPVMIDKPWAVFLTGLIGGAGNKFVHFLLEKIPKEDQGHDHKVMSLHVLFDMALSAIVSISVVVNYVFGWDQSDSVFGFFAAGFVLILAGRLSAELWKDDCPSHAIEEGHHPDHSGHAPGCSHQH